VVAFCAIAVFFAASQTIARKLDSQGLPGDSIVGGLIVVLAVLVLLSVLSSTPSKRRSRVVARAGVSLMLDYRTRFELPSSLRSVPFFSIATDQWSVANLLSGQLMGRHVMIFDRSYNADGYEPTVWSSCAATQHPIESRPMRIEPRHVGPKGGHGLEEVEFESTEFHRRWRVSTTERPFANAMVDERMMAWLLGIESDWTFEVGGRWALVETGLVADADAMRKLVSGLNDFLAHVPNVVSSMFPARDPASPMLNDPPESRWAAY
jgi:hypothetical protein